MHWASQSRSTITVVTCDATPHFLSPFCLSSPTMGVFFESQFYENCLLHKTLILSSLLPKIPSNIKHKVAFPHNPAWPLKPNPLCKQSPASSLPPPARFPVSPHLHSLPKAGSSEAKSGVSGGTGKDMLGQRPKTEDWLPWTQSSWQNVCLCSLNCLLVPLSQECFPPLWSYPSDAAPMQNSLEISCPPWSQPNRKQA